MVSYKKKCSSKSFLNFRLSGTRLLIKWFPIKETCKLEVEDLLQKKILWGLLFSSLQRQGQSGQYNRILNLYRPIISYTSGCRVGDRSKASKH